MTRLLCMVVVLCTSAPASAEHPSNGWFVWASNRQDSRHEIYRAKADGSEVTRLTFSGARFPSWSPDGRWVAYETVPGGRTRVMRWDGSEDREISTAAPKFWLWDSSRVVVMDSSDNLHKVNPDTGASTAWVRKSDFPFGSKDWSPSGLTADGRWLVTWTDLYRNGFTGTNGSYTSYHSAVVLDMNNKSDVFFFGRGCEPTTPPSGSWLYHVCGGTYTNPAGDEVSDCQWAPDIFKMKVTDRSSRSSYQAELEHPDDDFGHEYFPRVSNDGVWLMYGATNGDHDHDTSDYEIFIHRVGAASSNRERVTFNNKNDQWPHLYVGDLWSSAPASITLSPTSLSFSATEGGSNPSTKTVTVSNSGSGTLATVTTEESKSWLSVSRSGSGDTQTLTNSINIAGLSAGTYSGTVTVSAANASSSETYTVNLAVAEPGPALAVSPASLSFASTAGGGNPASKDVSVSNTGGGTLADAQVSESAGWLRVSRTGSGNNQTLINIVDIDGLADGTYNTTVEVSATGAGAASYSVSLVLSVELILASIEVVAGESHVLFDQSVALLARARDQYDNPFPAEMQWSASGGGELSPATSGGAVTEHDSSFTSDGSAGTFTITASSGGVEGSTTITVEAIAIPLRINCGSNEFAVDGWMADDAVVNGGSDWTNPNDIATDGVANAAPAYVYRSVRHSSPHSYDIPVPDGDYILRLHFADAYSDRAMTYAVEGETVLTDFDPVTAAGGENIAVVQEFQVSVSGGLQIEASSDGDVFEAGIEILLVPNEAPLVDAGDDKTILVGETAHLDGVVVDDGDEMVSSWSVDLGPGEVTITDDSAAATTATFFEAGYYVLRLSADDGELSGSDTMSVTVTVEDDTTDDPPDDDDATVEALEEGVVIEGSCSMNATGRTPMMTLLVLVLWRLGGRRH